MEIDFTGHLSVLELKPGDRFVLTSDQYITPAARDAIQTVWRKFAGDAPLLIMEKGMALGVVRDA